jgi:MFS family permease
LKKRIISPVVITLSMVSLFTDLASEMLYPVVPVYLQSIGFSIVIIGILEGFAEAVAGISKAWFGNLSDRMARRVPFVRLGYALSAISKPMLALFSNIWWVFASRMTDRLGKGIRTGARDAMLRDESSPGSRAKVFGFHRALDTTGAFLGPSIALLFLQFYPGQYKLLFLIAFLPGVAAIITTFFLSETKIQKPGLKAGKKGFFIFSSYWKKSPASFRHLASALVLFALVNSSDVFLLLKARQILQSDTSVIGLYILYNIVYALAAYPAGSIADRIGIKTVLLSGILLFSAVYFSMAFCNQLWQFVIVFMVYGIYAAATEGVSKAWISHLVFKSETATAFGTLAGLQNIAALLASTLAGLGWYYFSPSAPFLASSGIAIIVFVLIFIRCKPPVYESVIQNN